MNKTRHLTIIALLSAISFVLMIFPQFPILPGASFLKIDFSIVPVLLGTLLLGLKQGYTILILRSVLKLLLNNEGPGDLIGIPMNIMGMAVFMTIIVLVMRRTKLSKGQFMWGSVLGTIGLTLVMVILNYIYAVPLYAIFANFDIKATIGMGRYLLWMVVPFNLIEGILLGVVSGAVFFSFQRVLSSMHSQLN
ncbi:MULTISPECIES: ECF transporter S component [Weissella]|uniref:Riboflavin transporter n=2 Tax=Weissella TaxID=46255 RepID=A0A1L6RAU9_9LACO|nr:MULTISPECIES: ECF transporter S component [Weissella]APS41665.1 Substrate-specific component RibU of riboflavin ECF transporter [Weissella jogaejeotgali]NKY90497.1 ECF transporter S component [Weissella thailandensis]RDS60060.1 ECF transporter S component [Weissella thailandensis]GEP73849.1 riboflavin transporter [Weissella thailandensis]